MNSLAPVFEKAIRLGYGKPVIDSEPTIQRMLFLDFNNIVCVIANSTSDFDLKNKGLIASSLAYRILLKAAPGQLRAQYVHSSLEFSQCCRELMNEFEWQYSRPGMLSVFEGYDRDFGSLHSDLIAELYLKFILTLDQDVTLKGADILHVLISELRKLRDHLPPFSRNALDSSSSVLAAYRTLEVQPGCTDEELKVAYHRKVIYWHPDKFHAIDIPKEMNEFATRELARINEAYDLITTSRSSNSELVSANPQPPTAVGTSDRIPSKAQPSELWRFAKVLLRTLWRVSKILLISVLAVGVVAVLLSCAIIALKDHWDNQVRIEKGHPSRGSQADRFLDSITRITWLPREIWSGLLTIMTVLLLAFVFAGQWVAQMVLGHVLISLAVLFIAGISLVVWALRQEWRAEFTPTLNRNPTTKSWVMGFAVAVPTKNFVLIDSLVLATLTQLACADYVHDASLDVWHDSPLFSISLGPPS